jgi:Protein of unknown function (DUF2726)
MFGSAIIDGPYGAAPFVVLFASIFVIVLVEGQVLFSKRRRRYRNRPRYWLTGFDSHPRPDLTDVGQQLNAVMAATFQRHQVMSRSEYRAFKIVEDDVAAAQRGYRVFAQSCLGEFLDSKIDDAYRSGFHSINSKRVDILVVDQAGWPVLAVEVQGRGHYLGNAAGRDAVKKEALRKAGVAYVEIFPDDSNEQIRSRVREKLDWDTGRASRCENPSLVDSSQPA